MYSSDVLNICLETGIELSVRDGQLAYRGPASALTPELVGGLKANKVEIIHILCDQRTGPAALIVRARNGGECLPAQWVNKNSIKRPLGRKTFSQRIENLEGVSNGYTADKNTRLWTGIDLAKVGTI